MPYRVLSIDGGGVRGVISTVLMQRLAAMKGLEEWASKADLLAGTSTGGLLALGLASGYGLQEIRDVYEKESGDIFRPEPVDPLGVHRVFRAGYDNAALTRVVKRLFGRRKLKDLKRQVLITSFDLDNESPNPRTRHWKPKIFHNFPFQGHDGDRLAWKVALYTSAAPTYLPTADGYVDGGVYANNPSMCALAQVLDDRWRGRRDVADVVMMSIGTGTALSYVEGGRHDWGYACWVRPLVDLILDGTTGIADYQCARLLGDAYCRLEPYFGPGVRWGLDEAAQVPEMVDFARKWGPKELKAAAAFLRKRWMPDHPAGAASSTTRRTIPGAGRATARTRAVRGRRRRR